MRAPVNPAPSRVHRLSGGHDRDVLHRHRQQRHRPAGLPQEAQPVVCQFSQGREGMFFKVRCFFEAKERQSQGLCYFLSFLKRNLKKNRVFT